jgi:hypothetical protein
MPIGYLVVSPLKSVSCRGELCEAKRETLFWNTRCSQDLLHKVYRQLFLVRLNRETLVTQIKIPSHLLLKTEARCFFFCVWLPLWHQVVGGEGYFTLRFHYTTPQVKPAFFMYSYRQRKEEMQKD